MPNSAKFPSWLLLQIWIGLWVLHAYAYYDHIKCYGTGDCVLTVGNLGGGASDDEQRWMIECQDGEAMIGVYDYSFQFRGISQLWCFFMFPLKPPSQGLYPYYPQCNVRNFTLREFYCYDKFYPVDTYNTFVTGLFALESYDPVYPTMMKCCKTPPQYILDYNRCQWKYTHDKRGEHYDGQWIVKCDTNYVMTGMGQALNPWDNYFHWVWIQCCPVVTVTSDIYSFPRTLSSSGSVPLPEPTERPNITKSSPSLRDLCGR